MSDEQRDVNNKAFWDNLSNQLIKALTLLEKLAKVAGIAVTDVNAEVYETGRKLKDQVSNDDILAKISKDYIAEVNQINLNTLCETYASTIHRNHNLGIISTTEASKMLEILKLNIDTINWYKYFIHVKIKRALPSQPEEKDIGIQSDSNGSAKIAMLAIESSLGAWHSIYDIYGNGNPLIIDVMATLGKLLRLSQENFPNAAHFLRPGFDAGWEYVWENEEE